MRTPAQPLAVGLLAAGLFLGGCFPGYLRIAVDAAPDMNRSTPLYMLVRGVERKAFLGESYSDVAAKLSEPDPSVLRTQLVYPGRTYSLSVKHPKKGGVALYFLFTDPGGGWRLFVDEPLPLQVKTLLRGNQVREATK